MNLLATSLALLNIWLKGFFNIFLLWLKKTLVIISRFLASFNSKEFSLGVNNKRELSIFGRGEKLWGFISIIFLTFSCNNVKTPNVKVEIERFEDIFFNTDANNLYKVKEDFSFLFPPQYDDQIWINRLKDTIQNQLYSEVNLSFGDFSDQQSLIESFYSNYLGYDSEYKIPRLITLTTDVDYRKKIILT